MALDWLDEQSPSATTSERLPKCLAASPSGNCCSPSSSRLTSGLSTMPTSRTLWLQQRGSVIVCLGSRDPTIAPIGGTVVVSASCQQNKSSPHSSQSATNSIELSRRWVARLEDGEAVRQRQSEQAERKPEIPVLRNARVARQCRRRRKLPPLGA
jgi:hypothetical protein